MVVVSVFIFVLLNLEHPVMRIKHMIHDSRFRLHIYATAGQKKLLNN